MYGYSADVKLDLKINDQLFDLTHTGPTYVILRDESALPEGPAEVIVTIDGDEIRRPVEITDRHLVRRKVPLAGRPIE